MLTLLQSVVTVSLLRFEFDVSFDFENLITAHIYPENWKWNPIVFPIGFSKMGHKKTFVGVAIALIVGN